MTDTSTRDAGPAARAQHAGNDGPAPDRWAPGARPGRRRHGPLRHDHGSQFVADACQTELAFLGIASSPAFVREPEGNGCVERFIRTLKENLLCVRRFGTIEELRLALVQFQRLYNHTWIVEPASSRGAASARIMFCKVP